MPTFESVVFAGGGSRCFWHAGFWREVQGPLEARAATDRRRQRRGRHRLCAQRGDRRGRAAALPGRHACESPELVPPQPPRERPGVSARAHVPQGGAGAVRSRRRWRRSTPGPRSGCSSGTCRAGSGRARASSRRRQPTTSTSASGGSCIRRRRRPSGFWPEVVVGARVRTPEALADLILASSCSPPMTPLLTWKGRHVLDGGVVDNVPVCALDDAPGETLVMLTRRYPALPVIPGRTYVQPSATIPVSAWDYTNAGGLQSAYDLGRRDGEAFLRELAPVTALFAMIDDRRHPPRDIIRFRWIVRPCEDVLVPSAPRSGHGGRRGRQPCNRNECKQYGPSVVACMKPQPRVHMPKHAIRAAVVLAVSLAAASCSAPGTDAGSSAAGGRGGRAGRGGGSVPVVTAQAVKKSMVGLGAGRRHGRGHLERRHPVADHGSVDGDPLHRGPGHPAGRSAIHAGLAPVQDGHAAGPGGAGP